MHVLGLLGGKFRTVLLNLAWPSQLRCGQAGWLAGKLGVWLAKESKDRKHENRFIGNFCIVYSNLANCWYHMPESVQFVNKFGTVPESGLAKPAMLWPGWLGRLGVWLATKSKK